PDHLLAAAERVDVGRVEEVDPGLERLLDEGAACGLVEHPFAPARVAIGHAAEAQARDVKAGVAEADIVHRLLREGERIRRAAWRRARRRASARRAILAATKCGLPPAPAQRIRPAAWA